MSGDALLIRGSRDDDVGAIAAIYGYHVVHGVASFEEVAPSVEEIARRRAEIVGRGLPYLVAEREGRVVGYCYAGLFRPRVAYRFTLEDSIYVDASEVGRGIGRALLEPLPIDHPLRRAPNVILTPHIGYVTDENYHNSYPQIVEDVLGFLDGKPVRTI